jgi:predicted HTH domain antitoxin
MPSTTISTRLDSEEVSLLEDLAELSGMDRSTLVRSLVRRGMKELRFEQAIAAFRNEKVTLSRAAEIAGMDPWDFISRMGEQGVELHYEVEDFEADLAALADSR